MAATLGAFAMVLGVLALLGILAFLSPKLPSAPTFTEQRHHATFELALKRAQGASPSSGDVSEYQEGKYGTIDPSAIPDRLRVLFPAPEFPEVDEFEEICTVKTAFGCARKSRRLSKASAARVVFAELRKVPREELAAVIDSAASILPKTAVDRRAVFLRAVVEVEAELAASYLAAFDAYQSEVDRITAERARILAEASDKRQGLLLTGLWLIGAGAAVIVAASLLLVLFAIERHLRVLRDGSGYPRV